MNSGPFGPIRLKAFALALISFLLAGAYNTQAAPRTAPEAQIPAGIRLKGDKAFQARALEALETVRRTSTGSSLLKELGRTGHVATIRFGGQEISGALIYPTGNGDSVILWDPDYMLPRFPPFLFLYHELVHALHEAQQGKDIPEDEEERYTVGLGKYVHYPLSENALRKELKLPPRKALDRTEFVRTPRETTPARETTPH